jgi:hypothetical protein
MSLIKKYSFLFILAAIFILSILAVSPKGSFPLNDDWVYSYSVKHLFDFGNIKLSDWAAPSIVCHVYWGWLWCKIGGGFDFNTLRYSCMFLSFIGMIFFYLLLKKTGSNDLLSIFGTLLLFFNPLWFLLTFSFMTDITYLALSFISVYFYYSGLKNDRTGMLITGSLFASFCYLIRQLGVFIPFSIVLFLFFEKKLNSKKFLIICFLPVVSAVLHRYWLVNVHGLTWSQQTGQDLMMGFENVLPRLLGAFFYLGLFVIPFSFSAIFIKKSGLENNKIGIWGQGTMLFLSVLLAFTIFSRGPLPYFENVINRFGLGTITVHQMSAKAAGFMLVMGFWDLLTVLAAVSFLIFVHNFIKYTRISVLGKIFVYVYLSQFLMSVLRYKFFDRYTLLLLPVGVLLSVEALKMRKLNIPAFLLALLAVCYYSVCGTADYFAWNRAKWEAGEMAVKQGFKHEEIANGFDWDGWFTFQKNMDKLKTLKPPKSIGEWDWQQLNPYKVMVSFREPDDASKLLARVPYKTPLSGKESYVYAWKIY